MVLGSFWRFQVLRASGISWEMLVAAMAYHGMMSNFLTPGWRVEENHAPNMVYFWLANSKKARLLPHCLDDLAQSLPVKRTSGKTRWTTSEQSVRSTGKPCDGFLGGNGGWIWPHLVMISGKDISHASSIIWQEGLPPRLKLEGACRFAMICVICLVWLEVWPHHWFWYTGRPYIYLFVGWQRRLGQTKATSR